MLGGYGENKQPNQKVKDLVNAHKDKIGQELKLQVQSLNVESFQTQVVSGTNYKVKVKVNGKLATV